MASALKNLSKYDDQTTPDGSGMKFGIVVSEWNQKITHALYEGCFDTLVKHGVTEANIHTLQVPGSFELTTGAKLLASAKVLDGVICLGCVIKGETRHDEYINQAVAIGLTNLGIATGIPFIFGLLTTENEEQAAERAGGSHGNKGVEAAVTALRMAALRNDLKKPNSKIGY